MAASGSVARQDRAARTRESILTAAAELFDEQGYGGAGLTSIVRRAGVAKGALYFHFPSKESLAQAIISEQFRLAPPDGSYQRGVQGLVDLSYQLATALREDVLVRAAIRLVIEHASFTASLADPYRAWVRIVQRFLTAARVNGELRPGVSPARGAFLVISTFTGVQLVSEVLSYRRDLLDRVTDLWGALGPYLVAPDHLPAIRWAPPRPSRTARSPRTGGAGTAIR